MYDDIIFALMGIFRLSSENSILPNVILYVYRAKYILCILHVISINH